MATIKDRASSKSFLKDYIKIGVVIALDFEKRNIRCSYCGRAFGIGGWYRTYKQNEWTKMKYVSPQCWIKKFSAETFAEDPIKNSAESPLMHMIETREKGGE